MSAAPTAKRLAERTTVRNVLFKCFATLSLTIAVCPAVSHAQAGGRGAAAVGAAGPQQLQQVLRQLDLSADQKTKIDGIMDQAKKDAMAARQGYQDATPEERRQKAQDAQKIITDARTKIEAELTPEQKTKYYPLVAASGLKVVNDFNAALKTAVDKVDASEDQKKQLKDLFDDNDKTLASLKTDSEAVKDEQSLNDFQQKMTSMQTNSGKQLFQVLGRDDTQTVMRAAMQAMRPAQGAARGA
jgi:Spy/CpxP family protein refolding chaperone